MKMSKKEIGLLLAAVLFSLVLAELLLRVINPLNIDLSVCSNEAFLDLKENHNISEFSPHCRFGWIGQINASKTKEYAYYWDGEYHTYKKVVSINKYGFKDKSYELEPDKSKFRIAFIGDSFLAAWQVSINDTFSSLTRNYLSGCTKKEIETFNVGVSGWAVDNEFSAYENHVRKLDPEITILVLYLGNDVLDSYYPSYRSVYKFSPADIRYAPKPHYSFLERQLVYDDVEKKLFDLYLWILAKEGVKDLKQSLYFDWLYYYDDPNCNSLRCRSIYRIIENFLWKEEPVYLEEDAIGWHNARINYFGGQSFHIEKMIEIVKAMERAVIRDEGQFGVLLIDTDTIEPNVATEQTKLFQLGLKKKQYTEELLKRNEIMFLDITSIIRTTLGIGNEKSYRFLNDGHFNPRIHQLIAPYIGEFAVTRLCTETN